jgi:hypothetical protein
MIPILQPININTNIKKDEIKVKKDETKVKNISIPILPPINTTKYEIKVKKEVKKEVKIINKNYNHSLHVSFDVVDVSVKVIEISDDFKIKCPYIKSSSGNVYFLFQPLIKPFTNTNNNQRILYKFKSPEEKFSKGGKMFLTKEGLKRYIKMLENNKNRKNGIFNKDITTSFIKELSTFYSTL